MGKVWVFQNIRSIAGSKRGHAAMADPEHLAILKRGVEHWNRWRKEHPEIRAELTSAYLSETSMEWAEPDVPGQLSIADLEGGGGIFAWGLSCVCSSPRCEFARCQASPRESQGSKPETGGSARRGSARSKAVQRQFDASKPQSGRRDRCDFLGDSACSSEHERYFRLALVSAWRPKHRG